MTNQNELVGAEVLLEQQMLTRFPAAEEEELAGYFRGYGADPQTAAIGMIQRWIGETAISLVGLPLSFEGIRPPLAKLAPRLGEDNREILDIPE